MYLSRLRQFNLRQTIARNDVDGAEDGGAPQVSQNPRLVGRAAAMDQISAKVEAHQAPDLADFDEETGTSTPRVVAPPPEDEPEPDDAVILAPAEAEPEEDTTPKPKMVSIVVMGETIEVPEDRIIEAGKRTLQKESAADRRLQEAVNKERQAQALLERAQRLSGQDTAQPNQPEVPSEDAPQPREQANAATNGLTPEALFSTFESWQYQRDFKLAAKALESEFPDIVFDNELASLVAQRERQRAAEAQAIGEPLGNPIDALRAHCAAVRERYLKPAAKPVPVDLTDRQERKKTITAISAVNAKAPAPQPPKVLTTQEEIARMQAERKSYGRQLHNRSTIQR